MNVKHLIDRPCSVCEFHKENGCCKWSCVFEGEPTTKNNLGVDLISRADVLKLMQDNWHTHNGDWAMQESMDDIRALPSVTPQEPCDKCEVGNPCLYCKHEFEPKEQGRTDGNLGID